MKTRHFLWRLCLFSVLFGQVRGNLGKNGAWSALISKNAPKMKGRPSSFSLEVILFEVFFGQVWGNLG